MYPFRRADKDIFKTEIGFEYNHQGRSELHLTFGGSQARIQPKTLTVAHSQTAHN